MYNHLPFICNSDWLRPVGMMRPFPVVQSKFRFLLILTTREKGRRVPVLCNRWPEILACFWHVAQPTSTIVGMSPSNFESISIIVMVPSIVS